MAKGNEIKGCLIEKKGKYYTTIYYYVEGERVTSTKATGISVSEHKKREAERLLKERLAETEKKFADTQQKAALHSFAECFEKWIEYKAESIEESTADGYRIRSKTILQYFRQHNVMIEHLEPKDLLAFYEWALKYGRRNIYKAGAPTSLSRRTVRDQATLIKSFLNDAIIYKVITVNPADSVSVPRVKVDRTEEVAYMNKEQANRFLKFLKSEPLFQKLYLICKLGLYYGFRRSEVLGLRWCAIDFDGKDAEGYETGAIEINHTVVRITNAIIHSDNVKTSSSHRVMPMLSSVKKDLLELREYQKQLGIYSENGYLFLSADGNEFNPDYISKLFKKAVERCPGIPKNITFHGLRHSCCAIMFEEGKDIVTIQHWLGHSCCAIMFEEGKDIVTIQHWLGHSDISVTANIYNHVSKKWQNKIGNDLDGILE